MFGFCNQKYYNMTLCSLIMTFTFFETWPLLDEDRADILARAVDSLSLSQRCAVGFMAEEALTSSVGFTNIIWSLQNTVCTISLAAVNYLGLKSHICFLYSYS